MYSVVYGESVPSNVFTRRTVCPIKFSCEMRRHVGSGVASSSEPYTGFAHAGYEFLVDFSAFYETSHFVLVFSRNERRSYVACWKKRQGKSDLSFKLAGKNNVWS